MIRKVDSKGRVLLGSEWAGKYVVVYSGLDGWVRISELRPGEMVLDDNESEDKK